VAPVPPVPPVVPPVWPEAVDETNGAADAGTTEIEAHAAPQPDTNGTVDTNGAGSEVQEHPADD
jgi:hypothetical protein